jgi:hypothetical protein
MTLNELQKLLGNINWILPFLNIPLDYLKPVFELFKENSQLNSLRKLTPEAQQDVPLIETTLQHSFINMSFQNMNNNQDGCQSELLMGPMKRLQLDKLNLSNWFIFGLKGLIGIRGLMLLGLLSITWLKRLISQETNCYKK